MPLRLLLREAVPRVSLSRALIVSVVVVIHLLVLKVLWRAVNQALPNRPGSQVARPEQSKTIVFLLEPNAPAAINHRRGEPHPDARPRRADRMRENAVPEPVYGSEVSNAAAMPSAGAASVEVPKQSGSTLNLPLSREALKSIAPGLAARSPFQGRLPVTVERRIAEAAAETGPWTEERIDLDHIRLRRGTTCVILSRSQIANIDPFSDSIRRLPWAASLPSECR